MVRVKKLKHALDHLHTCDDPSVSEYKKSPAHEAVFELTTVEVFLVPFAETLAAGLEPPFEQRPIPHRIFLRANSVLVMSFGRTFDLSGYPELLQWARGLESVRKECLTVMGE